MAFGGRGLAGIIVVLLILINGVALGLTSNNLQKQIQDQLLVSYNPFELSPVNTIADGAGGLYFTEDNGSLCNLYHFDTTTIEAIGTIEDRCGGLLVASDQQIIYEKSVSFGYDEDLATLNYTLDLNRYKNKMLTRYTPTFSFPADSNMTRLRLFSNLAVLRDQSVLIPGFVLQPESVDSFVWQFDLETDESDLVFLTSAFTGAVEERRIYHQNPYGQILSIGDTLYYFDPISDQIRVNILSRENNTSSVLRDGDTTQVISTERSEERFDCLTSSVCEVMEIEGELMFFELDNSTHSITRSYRGGEDRISIAEGHYFFSMANVGLDHVVSLVTSASEIGLVTAETSDYIYVTYDHNGEVYDYKLSVNPDHYEHPWYAAYPRDADSFYVLTRNYTQGVGVSNLVLSTIRIGLINSLERASHLWKFSLPISGILILGVVYLYHRKKKEVGKQLYPQ